MISILNFDHVYEAQSFYRKTDYQWIDFTEMRNINGYCEPESLMKIEKVLKERRRTGITFIGNGNYHYITYLLLREIREPFTLVLFDYHTDLVPGIFGSSLLSCGSWVLKSLKDLPLLRQVVMIGVNEALEATIPAEYRPKVRLFPNAQMSFGRKPIKDLLNSITTEPVYISIDKDVLAGTEAVTDWDQGEMTLEQVLEITHYIDCHKKIVGLDVCGEFTPSVVAGFSPAIQVAITRNDRANGRILTAALSVIGKGK